jgi:hypothetical protein
MRTAVALFVLTSSLFVTAQARAQVDLTDRGLALDELPMDLAELPREAPASRLGFALQLGGGLTGFAQANVRDDYSAGGYWELRAVLGTRRVLSGELAYVGSHRRADAMGPGSEAALVGNGAEATVRAKLPLQAGGLRVEPFVFGGAGWSHYRIIGQADPRAVITTSSDAVNLPVGTGLVMAHDNLLLDLRLTYRATPGERQLRSWSAGVTVGCEI